MLEINESTGMSDSRESKNVVIALCFSRAPLCDCVALLAKLGNIFLIRSCCTDRSFMTGFPHLGYGHSRLPLEKGVTGFASLMARLSRRLGFPITG